MLLHPPARRIAEPSAKPRVREQPTQRIGQRKRIIRGNEEACFAVDDDFGNSIDATRYHCAAKMRCFEQNEWHGITARSERQDVGHFLQKRTDVSPITEESNVDGKFRCQALERLTVGTIARNYAYRVDWLTTALQQIQRAN